MSYIVEAYSDCQFKYCQGYFPVVSQYKTFPVCPLNLSFHWWLGRRKFRDSTVIREAIPKIELQRSRTAQYQNVYKRTEKDVTSRIKCSL